MPVTPAPPIRPSTTTRTDTAEVAAPPRPPSRSFGADDVCRGRLPEDFARIRAERAQSRADSSFVTKLTAGLGGGAAVAGGARALAAGHGWFVMPGLLATGLGLVGVGLLLGLISLLNYLSDQINERTAAENIARDEAAAAKDGCTALLAEPENPSEPKNALSPPAVNAGLAARRAAPRRGGSQA